MMIISHVSVGLAGCSRVVGNEDSPNCRGEILGAIVVAGGAGATLAVGDGT
jgi:hypothetical protein